MASSTHSTSEIATTILFGLPVWAIAVMVVAPVILIVALLASVTIVAMWFFGMYVHVCSDCTFMIKCHNSHLLIICSGCFYGSPTAAKAIAAASKELIEEEEPIGFRRLERRRRNKVESSTERQQDAQRQSVERGNGTKSGNELGNSRPPETGDSLNKYLKKEDYSLHSYHHTRTSVNKQVSCTFDHTSSYL